MLKVLAAATELLSLSLEVASLAHKIANQRWRKEGQSPYTIGVTREILNKSTARWHLPTDESIDLQNCLEFLSENLSKKRLEMSLTEA